MGSDGGWYDWTRLGVCHVRLGGTNGLVGKSWRVDGGR